MADSADDLLARARRACTTGPSRTNGPEPEFNDSAARSGVRDLDALLSAGGPLPAAWKRPPVIATLYATRRSWLNVTPRWPVLPPSSTPPAQPRLSM